jgi:hypothetical protein
MDRRDFHKTMMLMGIGAQAGLAHAYAETSAEVYREPARNLPVRKFDVVVAGGGSAGVVAAIAAARSGAKTALVELKGYPGGTITEGGTALHSFFNLYKAFPGVEKRQVVRGIPQEIIDELTKVGGTSGHIEMATGVDYDSVCTAIDTEMYKLVSLEMMHAAGVHLALNSMIAGGVVEGGRVRGAIVESRSGRELFAADAFVDCTAYGDLAAHAGAEFSVPEDYGSCNSIGLANIDLAKYHDYLREHRAVGQFAAGAWDGGPERIVRISGTPANLPAAFNEQAGKVGLSMMTTTVRDNYLMFVKIGLKVPGSVMNRDDMSKAEVTVRRNQYRAVELLRQYLPGCENAFIARTSPSLNIRRGRLIACDYDMTHEDTVGARHFDDEVFNYGFHDSAPRFQIGRGETYGLPFRAVCVKGIENLMAAGMMITSDHRAHMSTRNTVSCMAMGQATGTAAALCSQKKCGTRDLKYADLRAALVKGGVYFEA